MILITTCYFITSHITTMGIGMFLNLFINCLKSCSKWSKHIFNGLASQFRGSKRFLIGKPEQRGELAFAFLS